MNDIIRLLPDSVANQIAAGEVIQQPASVVKELVENAVDAGAKHITVILRDAGRTLVQVVDDGCGMSENDARLAFERHATSKIKQAADLFTLHTMGFRGEALASIAAVAQVELRTRRADDVVGTRLEISGSKVIAQEPAACPAGTNLSIKNLFFNVPARRKFLKKDSVEFSAVIREFERLALVNPSVELTLIHNDVTHHRLGAATVKQRIIDLFGKNLGNQLIPVETDTTIVKISGHIGRPENARRKGALQFLTVNGRNMRHPVFQKAVMQCYEELIPHDAKPNYFIDFQVDPQSIDVNIHPTKNEIKFENEAAIRQILVAAVREAMGRFNVVPAIDFEATDVPDIPPFSPDSGGKHEVDYDPAYNPFETAAAPRGGKVCFGSRINADPGLEHRRMASNWESLYQNFTSGGNLTAGTAQTTLIPDEDESPVAASGTCATGALQVKGRYIVTPCREGLMVVDQRRAHINVLYHKYLQEVDLKALSSQTLIFPEKVELSASQSVLLDSVMPDLRACGFDLAFLGDNTWSINALPAVLGSVSGAETVRQLVDGITETDTPGTDSLRHAIALGMASAAAIQIGQPMSSKEIEYLLSELFRLSTPALTPDGATVLTVVSAERLGQLLS